MIQPIKQEKWRRLFSEQEESGESVAGFCRARGVREALFYYWRKRLREAAMPQFVEVQVAKPQLGAKHSRSALESTIEVRLRNGRSLIVAPEFEASQLRALLAVVESES
jgi:transposase-like protein